LHPWNRKRRAKRAFTGGTLDLFVFKDFRRSLGRERLFNFASVRHITRQREFFGAIPRAFIHLEADRDHDRA
jgi:hypothetical protein